MRIISWNVNGIRAVEKRGFTEWLAGENPDVLCLNETKADPGQLPPALVSPPSGHRSHWASAKKRGYSGVAIYSAVEPREVRPLGIPEFDDEGRTLIAEYEDFSLIAAYFPNSQDERRRLGYKLAFCDAILGLCDDLAAGGRHFLLCGDYNVAHRPIDLARPKQNEDSPGYYPEEREWMDRFTGSGHADTFRHFHPDEVGSYTWWSYRAGARERNVGWRIDYNCVDRAFLPKVKSSIIRPEVTGSDHCPVEISLDI